MDVWKRIEDELETRPNVRRHKTVWLAKQLKTTVQVVTNWKTRGVPSKQYEAIAIALGWTVDRLLGRMPLPTVTDWPFELISRQQWNNLTERQRGAVEAAAVKALRDLPESPSTLSNTKDAPIKRH